MKKKLTVLLFLLPVLLMATSCGNTFTDYKKAVEKTGRIEKGQSSAEFSITMESNTEGMSTEDRNRLSYYSSMNGSFQSVFDYSRNQGIHRNYMNLGGLGFDFDVYQNGEDKYAKLPVIGKYLRLDDLLKKAGEKKGSAENEEASYKMLSDDTLEALGEEWIGMLQEKDVFKGKDIVLTTPDGEVKTTVYTITLNDSQFKAFEEKAIVILSGDKNLRSSYKEIIRTYADYTEEADFNEVVAKMKEYLMRDTLNRFRYTAYVDIDGYIVNETIEMEISRDAKGPGEPKLIRFNLDVKKWGINKDQKLEFPELTKENTLKAEDLDQSVLSSFKDLFLIKK